MPAQPLFSPRYPNNDLTGSFIPKHITLSNSQHVKTTRRKGLSRQHAVVWEDSNSKVLERNIRHSNGTIIYGERLSQEGVGSQLKTGGFSLDLICSRLERELKKSKDTGTELRNIGMVLDEIQDTLGSSLNMPPYSLPPVRPPQVQRLQVGEQLPSVSAGVAATHNGPPPDEGLGHPPPLTIAPETLLEIQSRLQDAQSSVASHVDKIKALESLRAEQEALKQEIRVLMKLTEARELYWLQLVAEREKDTSRRPSSNFEDDEDSEDDDAKSIMTVTAGEDSLECIDEEDEERMEHRDITEEIPEHDLETDEERMEHRDITEEIPEHDLETDEEKHRRREELVRPKTPESTIGIYMHAQSLSSSQRSGSPSSHKNLPTPPDVKPIEISEQVSALSEQVKAVMAVKSALEAQYVASQATIQTLEKKVESLEAMVKATQEQQTMTVLSPPPPPTIPIFVTPPPSVEIAKEKEADASLTEILSEWKKSVQGQWSSVQEEWSQEREGLNRARDKMREVNIGLEKMASIEKSMGTVKEMQTNQGQQLSVLQALVTTIQQHAQESGGSTAWFREHAGGVVNGEAIKHGLNGGLITPPSSPIKGEREGKGGKW